MKYTLLLLALLPLTLNAQRPTGTLSRNPNGYPCLTGGWTCYDSTISSPDVIETNAGKRAVLGVRWTNVRPVKGMLFTIGGHAGQRFLLEDKPEAVAFTNRMLAAGYDIVQYRHIGRGWPTSGGYHQGFLRVACRPATAIKYAHDHLLREGRFMITGSSQGSAAIAWALAMYGWQDAQGNWHWLHEDVDRAAYDCGPPMTKLVDACVGADVRVRLNAPGETGLCDQPDEWQECTNRHDTSSNRNWWAHNSAETADDTILPLGRTVGRYRYPNTRLASIVGTTDGYRIRWHADKLRHKFASVGQPIANIDVPGMGHGLNTDGFNALFNFLTAP